MPKTAWTLAPIVFVAVLYAWRVRGLSRRGLRPRSWKLACFAAGLAILVVALVSPIDTIGEERLFWVHMCQHVLIGDVAPFLVVLGLSGPLLRPVLALPGVYRLRRLTHPLVALPLWAGSLAAWHLPFLFDAALAHPVVHALQHASFFVGGAIVWAVLFELLPGPRWFGLAQRALFLACMWFFSLALSSVFLWSRHAFYSRYRLSDQRLGGGVMLLEGSFVMLAVLIWLGLRWFAETEAKQRLVEARAQG